MFLNLQRLTQQPSSLPKKANAYFTVHTLRHTFATRCYSTGVNPKAIQILFEHESVTTTLNTYVHVIQNTGKEILERMRVFSINNNIINDIR